MEQDPKVGILLANLGTPNAPTTKAVKAFLSEFLHDHRVIDLSRWLWCPLLHGIILPTRAPKVAALYQSIWMETGSPLMHYSLLQQQALQQQLQMPVELGMTYGSPSIEQAVDSLMAQGCNKILFFPLYPQYSSTTTAAGVDALMKGLKKRYALPDIRLVTHYFDAPEYIDALAGSIERHWQQHGKPDLLLCSYHGIPKRYVAKGDPYYQHCLQTTDRLIARLNSDVAVQTSFQSRFGKEEWLQPYTDETLQQLPGLGVKKLQVITPAFSVDCLETLEEISEEGKETFLQAGGESYQFIACLNDDAKHIHALAAIANQHIACW